MYAGYALLLAVVVLERGLELLVSRGHARKMFALGAVEHGAGHYPAMVALHSALLVGCVVEPLVAKRPLVPVLTVPMLGVVVAAQALRWWAIATLGPCWNTRVIVLPGGRRVTGGPYRWLRHPNYCAVVAEGLALPLVHSAWITALGFTVLDAALLRARIRTENAALTALRAA
jgi:methyltransferase